MEDSRYAVWLSLGFPWGSTKLGRLLKAVSAEEIYQSRDHLKERYPFLSEKECARLSSIPLRKAELIGEQCLSLGIGILSWEDARYPASLKEIPSPPPVLYYKGKLLDFNNTLSIAMVGTREASDYYLSVTGNLAYQLARAGVNIISGCAVGADRYAHIGALKAGGLTVGVMAAGLDVDYPAQNRDLREEIQRRGLLLSELPPGTEVRSEYFRVRNRIIAGLSQGVVVTQAPMKSGSLLTADHAVEQNRDLFCVPPSSIYDPACMGSARLIREGAKVIFSVYDILEEYFSAYPDRLDPAKILPGGLMLKPKAGEKKPQPPREEENLPPAEGREAPEGLSQEQKTIYGVLQGGARQIDEIAAETGLPVYRILSGLTEMELLEIVEAISGQRYRLLSER